MMVSWLFNSIDPALQPSVAYFETVKELWDDLKERFAVGNAPRIHQLKAEIVPAKQHGQSIVTYYTRLKGMWDELSSHSPFPSCTCGGCTCNLTTKFIKDRDDEKIHQFLMGLDDSVFGNVRTHILGMDPLPSLSKVYSMVVQEERHRTIVRSYDERSDAVSFAVRLNKTETNQQRGGAVEKLVCSHCGKTGHDITRCFEIIGYPEGWVRGGRGTRGGRGGGRSKGRGRVSAHAVQGNSSCVEPQSFTGDMSQQKIPGFIEVQMKQIMAILNSSSVSGASTTDEKLQGNTSNTQWLLDSGASHHMTGCLAYLQNVYKVNPSVVTLPNGEQVVTEHEGTVKFEGGIVLKRVLYVPCLHCNLISLSKLINDNKCLVTFTDTLCVVQDLTSRMPIGVGEMRDGIYFYRSIASSRASHVSKEDFMLWHKRMGHPSSQTTLLISSVKDDSSNSKNVCAICLQAKQTRDVFPVSSNKAVESFELIHCDIWGPYRIASHCGAHYFLTIVDDYSRAVWVYLMAEKKETSELLISFCKMVQNQFGKSVKCVRTDNGLEFNASIVKQFYGENGILHQTTCVYTPQQNGRVERNHRHILNVARALRFQAHLPIEFWGECILTAAYLINRIPTRILENKTPYELLFGREPSYNLIRVFGCLCYISHKSSITDKFESRSRKCVFIGYPFGKKGWRVYDMSIGDFIVSRDVVFSENVFPFAEVNNDKMFSPVNETRAGVLGTLYEENDEEQCVEGNEMLLDRGSNDSNHIKSNDECFAVEEQSHNVVAQNGDEAVMEQQHNDERVEASRESNAKNQLVVQEQRVRRIPERLQDYICYTARVDTPVANSELNLCLGTAYPINKCDM